jgi:hypothetical protein
MLPYSEEVKNVNFSRAAEGRSFFYSSFSYIGYPPKSRTNPVQTFKSWFVALSALT